MPLTVTPYFFPPPSPWQSPIYFLSGDVHFLDASHNGILQHVPSPSLSIWS